MTQQYLNELVLAHPSISEIWLIGSRANERSRPDSDWDYLVWADDVGIIEMLRIDTRFNDPTVDLLVVVNGVSFVKPWPEPTGTRKRGMLDDSENGWQWQQISGTQARYLDARNIVPEDINTWFAPLTPANAILVYRRPR